MTLSVVFIFSVVALHGMYIQSSLTSIILTLTSHRQGHAPILRIDASLDEPFHNIWPIPPRWGWPSVAATTTFLYTSICDYPCSFP